MMRCPPRIALDSRCAKTGRSLTSLRRCLFPARAGAFISSAARASPTPRAWSGSRRISRTIAPAQGRRAVGVQGRHRRAAGAREPRPSARMRRSSDRIEATARAPRRHRQTLLDRRPPTRYVEDLDQRLPRRSRASCRPSRASCAPHGDVRDLVVGLRRDLVHAAVRAPAAARGTALRRRAMDRRARAHRSSTGRRSARRALGPSRAPTCSGSSRRSPAHARSSPASSRRDAHGLQTTLGRNGSDYLRLDLRRVARRATRS